MIRPDGTADSAILTTITEAQRVPSIGQQLPAFAEPARPTCRACGLTGAAHMAACYDPAYRATITAKPVPLNLWDTSADSIPETWSL